MKHITFELVKGALREKLQESYGVTEEQLVTVNNTLNTCVDKIMISLHNQLENVIDNFENEVDDVIRELNL